MAAGGELALDWRNGRRRKRTFMQPSYSLRRVSASESSSRSSTRRSRHTRRESARLQLRCLSKSPLANRELPSIRVCGSVCRNRSSLFVSQTPPLPQYGHTVADLDPWNVQMIVIVLLACASGLPIGVRTIYVLPISLARVRRVLRGPSGDQPVAWTSPLASFSGF